MQFLFFFVSQIPGCTFSSFLRLEYLFYTGNVIDLMVDPVQLFLTHRHCSMHPFLDRRFYGLLYQLMMSMGFMADSLNSSDPSKSTFFEFGHGHPEHQQHSQGHSHIYPVNGLQSAGHSQHGSPFSPSASSYGRSLGYAYPRAVNTHYPSAYMPYQHNNHSLAHSRLEETGTCNINICLFVIGL